MNLGQKIIISAVLLLFGNITFANGTYHYHGERGHSHPLPATGIAHRHGNGVVGTATKPNNPPNTRSSTDVESAANTNTATNPSETTAELESVEERQCEFKGGSWNITERSCKYTYSDAGKICTDSSDCQGRICVALQKNPNLTQGICPQDNLQRISDACRNGYLLQGKWQAKNC